VIRINLYLNRDKCFHWSLAF